MLTTKYIFPLETKRPTFTIYSESDLEQIPLDSQFNLIIKGKDLIIPLEEIQGDCIVRQRGCQFPLLEKVWGMLSVDAAHTDFPELELVVGNCNLHENDISVPKLKEVWGQIKIGSNNKLPSLQFARSSNIVYLSKNTPNITLTKDSNIPKVNGKNPFNVNVKHFDKDIPVRIIYGNLTIEACSPSFSSLECVFGDISITPEWTRRRNYNYSSQDKKPVLPILFPKLQRVFGRLLINKSGAEFPELQQVNHLSLLIKCNSVQLDALRWVSKGLHIQSQNFIRLPALKRVNKNLLLEQPHQFECPSLEYIGGNVKHSTPIAPNLKTVGGCISLSEYSTVLPSLSQISGLLLKEKEHLDKIPEVKVIDEIIYRLERHEFPKESPIQINHALFNLDAQITIDESGFYITNMWFENLWETARSKRAHYPFIMFVALLKLRHGSFQNFRTRQLLREWPQFKGKHWKSLIQKIERIWDDTPKYSVSAIFKLKSRRLRRFCFSFVGVEEIMDILKAERISTEGIEMDYFQYDDEGNETKINKHNVYEIYRASITRMSDLNSWGARRRLGGDYIYAVKCWCTSTTKAHWLWVESLYISDPLTAIASTFRMHENVIPHIKCLKRQGDIMICEMEKEVIPVGRIRPLTKEEYFSLLKAES